MITTSATNNPIALGAGTPAAPAAPNNDLGKDAFLQLLVTQLRNQDPTNPQDGQEFVAQLATFTQVEQMTSMNGALSEMNSGLGFMSGQLDVQQDTLGGILSGIGGLSRTPSAPGGTLVSGAALLGRVGETSGAHAHVDGGEARFGYRLDAASDAAQVTIRDASGAVVRTLELGAQAAGEHTLAWDGRDADGNPVAPGTYSAQFSGQSADGSALRASGFTRGEITRVGLDGGVLNVWMGGLRVPAASLTAVG
jgi:flagellar basal-body rod modification protein FlgD